MWGEEGEVYNFVLSGMLILFLRIGPPSLVPRPFRREKEGPGYEAKDLHDRYDEY